MKNTIVYADNAATTKILPCAITAMCSAPTGNPNSTHAVGREARKALEEARKTIAECINAEPEEIIFTSGATEANNMALNMLAHYAREHWDKSFHISGAEHSSIYNQATRRGLAGVFDGSEEHQPFRSGDVFSVMLANNETGEINDVSKIVNSIVLYNWQTDYHYYAHTDATAAVGHIPIDVKALGVDYLSASGHKFGAPAGIGFLYVKKGAPIYPIMYGGGQENGKRPGTTPVALACAMAAALKYRTDNMPETLEAIRAKRDRLARTLASLGWRVNTPENSLPGTLSVTNTDYKASTFLPILDSLGVCCSAGSACNAGSDKPSRVLLACGFTEKEALSTIRISISEETTWEEIEYIENAFAETMKVCDEA